MDVFNSLNNMRVSPVLVAVFATAAALGASKSAQGQTAQPSPLGSDAAESSSRSPANPVEPADQPTATSKAAALPGRSILQSPGDRLVPMAIATPEMLAQTQPQPQPSTSPMVLPGPGQGGEPQQETPNRIEISPTAPPSEQPSLQAPNTPTAPTDQPAPTPTPQPTTPQPAPSPDGSSQPTPDSTPAPSLELSPPGAAPGTTPPQTSEPEPRVLVGEVVVQGAEGTYQDEVYRVIRTQPGRTTTRSQLQEDINAIFKTGYFSSVRAVPTDTPLGVRVTFEVTLNPALQAVRVEGATVLPQSVIDEAFRGQQGTVINLNQIQEGVKRITKWYQDNGYVLAQVIDAPRVAPDGTVTLDVAEGQIEDIQVQFVTKDGATTDAKGNPIRGRTRPFIVTREFELKPGAVFNRNTAQSDLQRVFGLGIFEDVKLSLNPGQDPRKVVVVANVAERRTANINLGAGISSASGLFGTVSFQEQNLGGNNQKLGAEFQFGTRQGELLFDLGFTDPWIAGDPYRTSYSIDLFRRRTISLIFDGGKREVRLPNNDRPRVVRTGADINFSRPLNRNPYRRSEWTASLGAQYQRVVIQDADGNVARRDERGNQLSFSGTGKDDLFTIQFGAVRDLRNDPLRPTRGSLLRVGTEQSIPIGQGSIFFNRLRGSYSFYVPTRLVRISPGCRAKNASDNDCPQTFAFNIQGGTVLGDLPPYEAFSLGGSNSVRGYDEGDLAAARSFLQATAEFRFPIFSIVSGALFVDAATDFGSQGSVPGDPGGARRKPGSGVGYGLGVRIQSPLGPIRIDYGFNDQGDSRLHFGIGERF